MEYAFERQRNNVNMDDGRSQSSGRLFVIIALFTTTVVGLTAAVAVLIAVNLKEEKQVLHAQPTQKPQIIQPSRGCLSEQCLRSAAHIRDSLDHSVDPCDDFYQFACGAWFSRNPIPETLSKWDQLTVLSERVLVQLKDILVQKPAAHDIKPIQITSKLYQLCLDTDKLERLGLDPLIQVLDMLGMSTTLPTWRANFDWLRAIAMARRKLGISILVGFQVKPDYNRSRYDMFVEQTFPMESTQMFLDPEMYNGARLTYKRYMQDMVKAFLNQRNSSISKVDKFVDDVLNFTIELAKIIIPADTNRDPYEMNVYSLQNLMEVGERKMNPQLNWTRYLEFVMKDTNVKLNFNMDLLMVKHIQYLQKLGALISNTDPVIIERYLWWQIVVTLAPVTLQEFRDLTLQYKKKISDGPAEERWQYCVKYVNSNLAMAVSYLYVQKHFNSTSRIKALEIMKNIRSTFEETIPELDWMNEQMKETTSAKASALQVLIGFPDWMLTVEELSKYYRGAEVMDGKWFETYVNFMEKISETELEVLRKKPDIPRWKFPVTGVHAWWTPRHNTINIPAGILQPPFFDLGLESLNYGAIGSVMGHEIVHGINDNGRLYDGGNQKDWWRKTASEHGQCFVLQYNKFHISQLGNNITVNGTGTQYENIADNGGLRQALRAYQKFHATKEHKLTLPELVEYTPEQLFFLSFAHIWCGNFRDSRLRYDIQISPYSPHKFRVLGPLFNLNEFSEAWSCPPGSPMNPSDKCILW